MRDIGILIVDDHTVAREGLRVMLQGLPMLQIVGESGDGAGAVELAAARPVDIVLMDYKLPGLDGIEATQMLKSRSPQISVILMSVYGDISLVAEALLAGADGYLLKTCSRELLQHAVQVVAHGYAIVDSSLLQKVLQMHVREDRLCLVGGAGADVESLTGPERALLKLVADGRSNKEIAAEFGVSQSLVRRSVQMLMMRLHARRRIQAAAAAVRLGLI